MTSNDHVHDEFTRDLAMRVTSVRLIKENPYCFIYFAEADGRRAIIKKYKGGDPRLAQAEAQALDFYHEAVKDNPQWIDSQTLKLNPQANLLCIGFVEGEPFSEFLYRSRRDPALQERSCRMMQGVGAFLRRLQEITSQPGAQPAPFLFEYLAYCSAQLRGIPVLGALLFRGLRESAAALSREYQAAAIAPGFVHGDLVFRNIHVSGDRVGLIDFANVNPLSHVLNDVYNLWFSLQNMMLPKTYKAALWAEFAAPFDGLEFPQAAHAFYFEYHRRRWLMLKLKSRRPMDRLQALRGLCTFARPARRACVLGRPAEMG